MQLPPPPSRTIPPFLHVQAPLRVQTDRQTDRHPCQCRPGPNLSLWMHWGGLSGGCVARRAPASRSCYHQHARGVVLRNNVYDLNPLLRLFN